MDPIFSTREEMFDNLRIISENLRNGVQAGQLSSQQIRTLIDGLPRIKEPQVIEYGEKDNFCPICFVPYLVILTEEEMASAMDSPAHPVEDMGVTKLTQPWQCGHMFCRRDISKWIADGHSSCPMCRRNLLENPTSDQQETAEEAAEIAARLAEFTRANEFIRNETDPLVQLLLSSSVGHTELEEMWRNAGAAGAFQPGEAPADDRREYSGMYS
ncbi:hypothetical protein HYPSUDRAFT_60876 [Hypholoma sublateritium FD-334 SS-4]|uniref:RING-type domain-containing protein n=1 Tax=Hypholoma sublateritium (strain FD-334 SS-4) TaxID=945553 RepID=A0A0D2N0V8_HYPSF|nr:hypothetical protein HYPSUDRAFT_60876 [Hypholoma sublateritium FD-334 SS-4]